VYYQGAAPVEQYYDNAGLLLNFEITGGIPETMPVLMEALQPYLPGAASSREGPREQEAMAVA
jgi:adenylate kinase